MSPTMSAANVSYQSPIRSTVLRSFFKASGFRSSHSALARWSYCSKYFPTRSRAISVFRRFPSDCVVIQAPTAAPMIALKSPISASISPEAAESATLARFYSKKRLPAARAPTL